MQNDAPVNNPKPAVSEGYTPPTNLYAFPPNIDAIYPPPEDTRKPISISGYPAPSSGPINYPIYPGPIPNPPLDDKPDADRDNGNDNTNMDSGSPDRPSDDMQIFATPPSNILPEKKPALPPLPFLDHQHDHNHDHDHHFDDHAPYDDSFKHLHGFDVFPGIYHKNVTVHSLINLLIGIKVFERKEFHEFRINSRKIIEMKVYILFCVQIQTFQQRKLFA